MTRSRRRQAAQALGVKVYTIGVGKRGMAPMPVFMDGQKVGYQNVPVDVDEDTLQKIAQTDRRQILPRRQRGDSSGKFTPRSTSWKKRRRSSTNSRNTRNCFRGSCRAGWRCCCLKLRWDKPCSGGCHEIYDLRFTIYDLKMRFASTFLWLLLVFPPALALFFWWASRTAAAIAGAIHPGAAVVRADRRRFAGAAENPVRLFDSGRGAADCRAGPAAVRI